MKDEQYVKSYFAREGTVAKWWNPTESSYSHIFAKQIQMIKEWLSEEDLLGSALEVSCGKGRVTAEISGLFEAYTTTDISNEMLSIAKERCTSDGVQYEQADAENLPFDDDSFDFAFCLESLVHYPNPKMALGELHRVLKNGGKLIVDSDNKYSLRRIAKKAHQVIQRSKKQFGEDIFTPYSEIDLRNMVSNVGFTIDRFAYLGLFAPITLNNQDGSVLTVLGSEHSKSLQSLGLDEVPIINRLATYHIVEVRK